ncbi:MAG: hypothetical protein QNL62_09675 [Gammaproteobacteria bacterium]|nr:hypothetical protein [Gammaproteobacteria bacterium]
MSLQIDLHNFTDSRRRQTVTSSSLEKLTECTNENIRHLAFSQGEANQLAQQTIQV